MIEDSVTINYTMGEQCDDDDFDNILSYKKTCTTDKNMKAAALSRDADLVRPEKDPAKHKPKSKELNSNNVFENSKSGHATKGMNMTSSSNCSKQEK